MRKNKVGELWDKEEKEPTYNNTDLLNIIVNILIVINYII